MFALRIIFIMLCYSNDILDREYFNQSVNKELKLYLDKLDIYKEDLKINKPTEYNKFFEKNFESKFLLDFKTTKLSDFEYSKKTIEYYYYITYFYLKFWNILNDDSIIKISQSMYFNINWLKKKWIMFNKKLDIYKNEYELTDKVKIYDLEIKYFQYFNYLQKYNDLFFLYNINNYNTFSCHYFFGVKCSIYTLDKLDLVNLNNKTETISLKNDNKNILLSLLFYAIIFCNNYGEINIRSYILYIKEYSISSMYYLNKMIELNIEFKNENINITNFIDLLKNNFESIFKMNDENKLDFNELIKILVKKSYLIQNILENLTIPYDTNLNYLINQANELNLRWEKNIIDNIIFKNNLKKILDDKFIFIPFNKYSFKFKLNILLYNIGRDYRFESLNINKIYYYNINLFNKRDNIYTSLYYSKLKKKNYINSLSPNLKFDSGDFKLVEKLKNNKIEEFIVLNVIFYAFLFTKVDYIYDFENLMRTYSARSLVIFKLFSKYLNNDLLIKNKKIHIISFLDLIYRTDSWKNYFKKFSINYLYFFTNELISFQKLFAKVNVISSDFESNKDIEFLKIKYDNFLNNYNKENLLKISNKEFISITQSELIFGLDTDFKYKINQIMNNFQNINNEENYDISCDNIGFEYFKNMLELSIFYNVENLKNKFFNDYILLNYN